MESDSRHFVAEFGADAGTRLADVAYVDLVGALQTASDAFATVWDDHEVQRFASRKWRFHHDEVGDKARDEDPDFRTSGRFIGDGTHTVEPAGTFPGTHPMPVSKAQARLLCRNFDACGHSNHSGQGNTLWVILEHCAGADIPYNLQVLPGMGYYLEHSKAIGDGLALRMSVETEHGALED